MKSLNLIDFHVFLIAIFNFSDFSREKNILKSGVNSRVCYKRLFMGGIFFSSKGITKNKYISPVKNNCFEYLNINN